MNRFLYVAFALLIPTFLAADPGKPVIVGQNPLSTNEEQSITIQLWDLHVQDSDSWYPWGFTMQLYEGANYTLNGRTVIPAINFHGTLTVPVTVEDGQHRSEKYDLKITVNPINDAPVITAHRELQTTMNTPITLKVSDLAINDPDNKPEQMTLTVLPGNNYTVSGTTVTPFQGFIGSLTVPVVVSDGQATSPAFNVIIPVIAPNEKPVITGQVSLSTPVSTPITLKLEHLTVTDTDDQYPDGFTLTLYEGENYTFTGHTVTPDAGYTGALYVTVTVNDGKTESPEYEARIDVGTSGPGTGEKIIDIPTVFTPNNDNANDTWRVRPMSNVDVYHDAVIRVFNKRGKLVFESNGFAKEWDGRYNGEPVPADTYYYVIDLNNSAASTAIYRGVINILR